ncbi:MAG: hypothetical protein ACRCUQ_03400 [Alphaproteobacteria bacterium]
MKKFLFLMFTCATATTVSYAGDRLRMLEEAHNASESKGPNAKKIFDKLVHVASEDYEAATSRVQNLVEAVERAELSFKKSESDGVTLKRILEKNTEFKEILESPSYSSIQLEDSVKSLTSKLETLSPEFLPPVASQDMLNFLREKAIHYGYRTQMIQDFYLRDTSDRWENDLGRNKKEKNPLGKITFYQNLLDSIDENSAESLPQKWSNFLSPDDMRREPSKISCFQKISISELNTLACNFTLYKPEKIKNYGKMILDSLRQKFPDDEFLSTSYTSLAEELDDLSTFAVKKNFENVSGHKRSDIIDFLAQFIPDAWAFVIKKNHEATELATENLKSFLQEHIDKWSTRAKQEAVILSDSAAQSSEE